MSPREIQLQVFSLKPLVKVKAETEDGNRQTILHCELRISGYLLKMVLWSFLILSRWWMDKCTFIPTSIKHEKNHRQNKFFLIQHSSSNGLLAIPLASYYTSRVSLHLSGLILYPPASQDWAYAQRNWINVVWFPGKSWYFSGI